MKRRRYEKPVLEIIPIETETIICFSENQKEHEVNIDPGTSIGKPGRSSGYRTEWKTPSASDE